MSAPIASVPPFRPGMTTLRAADLNAMLAECKRAATHNNTHGEIMQVETWLARIVRQGPDEEEDYTDARYWVRRCRCSNVADVQTVAPTFELVSTPMEDKYEGGAAILSGARYEGHRVEFFWRGHLIETVEQNAPAGK